MLCSGLLVLSLLSLSAAYPSGPPLAVCSNGLQPQAPHQNDESNDTTAENGGYMISTDVPRDEMNGTFKYTANHTYKVVLHGANAFKGWLLQAKDPDVADKLLGSFILNSTYDSLLHCSNDSNATVVHANPTKQKFRRRHFIWVSPPDKNGTVDFYYTVVPKLRKFYSGLRASRNFAPEPESETTEPNEKTTEGSEPTEEASQQPTEAPVETPASPQPQSREGADKAPLDKAVSAVAKELIFEIPPNCAVDTCTFFANISRNHAYPGVLDFYMQGNTNAWLAIGFSDTPSMFAADVFACNRNPDTEQVEVLDTWNEANTYSNIPDADQRDIKLVSSSYSGGTMKCRFTRTIAGIQSTRSKRSGGTNDLNLNKEYYVLYGRGNVGPVADRLLTHIDGVTPLPSVSSKKVNPVTDTGAIIGVSSFGSIKRRLVQAHGILMLIAWPLLAATAIFFAAKMRRALPKGEWFQVHRAFMLTALFLTLLAVVLIFVSQAHNSIPGLIQFEGKKTAHFVIGIIVTLLQIINPIIAAFRCKPDSKHRLVFVVFHDYFVGFPAAVLAYVNIGLGIAIFTTTYSRFGDSNAPLWLYVAYVVLIVLIFTVAIPLIQECVKGWKKWKKVGDPDGEEITLSVGDQVVMERKFPHSGRPSSPREVADCLLDRASDWTALLVFLAVTLPAIFILIVLIAV